MQTTSELIDVGPTKLYHEVRGGGPALLFITGSTGDAGEWAQAAQVLAKEFTVVTYDRRGFSRSPRPDGWTATTVTEQEIVDRFGAAAERAMAEGGPRHAMAEFMRANAGDEVFDLWSKLADPKERDRVLDNGAVFFPIEVPWVVSFVPDRDGLRASGVPLTVVVGEQSRGTWFEAAAAWLAEGAGAARAELPGGHVGFATHPEEFVELVRRLAR